MKRSIPQSHLRCPLNAILGSEASIRLLRELFRHGGALGATRLARDAGLSRYGARVALALLAEAKIVETLGSGRTVLYRVDMRYPLATVLAELFRAEEARVDTIISAVRAAADDPTILAAWIYGSFARGEDQLYSDLDIAVVTRFRNQTAVDQMRGRLDEFGARLRFRPSVVGVDFADVTRMSAGDPWWTSLVREAIVIKGGRPETLLPIRKAQAIG